MTTFLLQRIIPLLIGAGLLGWLFTHLSFIRLEHPALLWYLLGLIPLALLVWLSNVHSQRQLSRLIKPQLWDRLKLQPARSPLVIAIILKLLALSSLVLALARPQGPPTFSGSRENGLNILMAMDISDSSKATDLYPNRLEATKQAVRELLQNLNSDRAGLAVFSGETFAVAPFTHDYTALETLLSDIDTSLLSSRGTNIPALTEYARERFSQNAKQGGVLIIFSDGENHEGDAVRAIEKLSSPTLRIMTVGTGTPAGGQIPEDSDDWGATGFKQYQGEIVITRLNEKTLKAMAKAGNGTYTRLGETRKLLTALDQARRELPSAEMIKTHVYSHEERFQFYLLLTLFLLVLSHHVGLLAKILVWQKSSIKLSPFSDPLKKIMRISLFSVLALHLQAAFFWPWIPFQKYQAGEKAYHNKNYPASLKAFKETSQAAPRDNRPYYNQGNALYQSKQYQQAAEAFRQSLQRAHSPQAKALSLYNLGNSYYRQGKNAKNPEKFWQQALAAFEQSLALNSGDLQTRENRDFVQKQLQKRRAASGKQKQQPQQRGNSSGPQQRQRQKNQGRTSQRPQSSKKQRPGPQPSPQNQFSEAEVEKFLQSLEENERENRARKYFQRTQPSSLKPEDLMNKPLEELQKLLKAQNSQQKDW